MIREGQVFLLAVQFLTRLPLPRDLPFSPERLNAAMKYLPLVGLGIGVVAALALWLGTLVFPPVIAVLLSTAVTLLVTGALHEDGLADTLDGLGGGQTREKALAIMRDSCVGTYAVLGLGLTMALKIAALAELPIDAAILTLIVGHVISRYAAVLIIFASAYARVEGAKFAAPTITAGGHAFALFCAVAAFSLLWSVLGLAAVAGLLGAGFLAGAVTFLYLRKLGGFTGDCLGATQQMAELGLFLGVLAWL